MFRTPIGTHTSVFSISISPPKVEIADRFAVKPNGSIFKYDRNGRLRIRYVGGVEDANRFYIYADHIYSIVHPGFCIDLPRFVHSQVLGLNWNEDSFLMRWYDQVAALVVMEPLLCDLIRWRVCGFL